MTKVIVNMIVIMVMMMGGRSDGAVLPVAMGDNGDEDDDVDVDETVVGG